MKRDFLLFFLLSAAVLVLLAGCGDDVTNTTNVTGARTVADLSAAGTCGASALGELVLNEEDGELYVCDGAKWKSLDAGEPSCELNSVTVDGVDGVEIACGNARDTVLSGGKGDKGDKGDGCTARRIAGVGVEVACGDVVDTLCGVEPGAGSEEPSSSSDGGASSSSESVEPPPLCGTVPYDSTAKFCDARDSALYDFVRIGSQTWMKQNLNYDYKVNGASYGSYCLYTYYGEYTCDKYGRLYTWGAAMDSAATGCGDYADYCHYPDTIQGICPTGWHLPKLAEWDTLFAAVAENLDTVGTALKAATGWTFGNGTNSSGFSAAPSGFMTLDGDFFDASLFAYFWSSSWYGWEAWYVRLDDDEAGVLLNHDMRSYGYAVRCVKNGN